MRTFLITSLFFIFLLLILGVDAGRTKLKASEPIVLSQQLKLMCGNIAVWLKEENVDLKYTLGRDGSAKYYFSGPIARNAKAATVADLLYDSHLRFSIFYDFKRQRHQFKGIYSNKNINDGYLGKEKQIEFDCDE